MYRIASRINIKFKSENNRTLITFCAFFWPLFARQIFFLSLLLFKKAISCNVSKISKKMLQLSDRFQSLEPKASHELIVIAHGLTVDALTKWEGLKCSKRKNRSRLKGLCHTYNIFFHNNATISYVLTCFYVYVTFINSYETVYIT